MTVLADMLCMLAGASLAVNVRFLSPSYRPSTYLVITLVLPLVWAVIVRVCGGYDARFIGVGSDEFRKVLNAGLCLTAVVAIASYVTRFEVARLYVAIALPTATLLDLVPGTGSASDCTGGAGPGMPCIGWWRWGTRSRSRA